MLLPWLLSSVVTTTTTGKTHTHSRQSALLPTASCCCVSSIFCLSVTASEHRWGALWVRYDVMGKVKLSHTGREQTERPRKDQLVKEREQLGPNTAARHAGKSTVRGGGGSHSWLWAPTWIRGEEKQRTEQTKPHPPFWLLSLTVNQSMCSSAQH